MLQDPELGIEVRDTLSKNLCDVRSSERSVTATEKTWNHIKTMMCASQERIKDKIKIGRQSWTKK